MEIDPDALAAAVSSCSGVAGLAVPPVPGHASEETTETFPPGAPSGVGLHSAAVEGGSAVGNTEPLWLRYDESSVNVSIVAYYGPSLLTVTEDIEAVARPLIGARRLIVTVEDVEGY